MHRLARGFLAILVFAASCTGAASGPRRRATAEPRCTRVPAELDQQISRATAERDAAYAEALAARRLTPWTGTLVGTFSRPADRVDTADHAGPPPAASVATGVEIDLGYGLQHEAPHVELVSDASGTVFLVQRQPTGSGTYHVACGCGPVGRGVLAVPVRYVAVLPAGTTYGGTVTIAYPDRVPVIGWDNMQAGRPCPAPPEAHGPSSAPRPEWMRGL